MARASAELVGANKGEKQESAVVKKLKQPKVKNAKSSDGKGAASAAKEGGEAEEEKEEEEEKGGVASLMIVKTAGEAWKRLQERLKEAPIIQV